jgi:hypothetical protein
MNKCQAIAKDGSKEELIKSLEMKIAANRQSAQECMDRAMEYSRELERVKRKP